MSPKTHTTIRTVVSILFLCAASVAPWLTPAKALAVLGSLTAILGGAIALSNLFHVPAKAVTAMQGVLDVIGDVRAAVPAQTMAAMKKIAGASLLLLALGALAVPVSACNASSQQVQTTVEDGAKVAACVLGVVLGGQTDPMQIAGQCAGAVPSLIVAIIDDFTAQKPAPDGGMAMLAAPALSDAQRAYLADAKAKAMGHLAAASKSP